LFFERFLDKWGDTICDYYSMLFYFSLNVDITIEDLVAYEDLASIFCSTLFVQAFDELQQVPMFL
jgi:hypothetical protein